MKPKLTALLFLFFLLSSLTSLAQNPVIDYAAWNLTNPPCNIFAGGVNVPATVGGNAATVYHGSIYGQPKYISQAVELPVDYINASDTRGTQYRLAYSFKQGYSYEITINAAEKTNTHGTSQTIYMRAALSSISGTTNPPCTGPDNRDRNVSGSDVKPIIAGASFENHTFSYPSLAIAYPSLEITAYPGLNGGPNAIRIRKITITETAPAASFAISSSVSSLACGATTPVQFTVNSIPGVTNYTWNLGSATNGWLYNGSPAPLTITTGVSNTLTLTPDCGKALSSISATVTANNINYNTTNSATISLSQPSYSISGASSLCSGSTSYTLNGMLCNSTIAWTQPPSNFGSLSSVNTSPTTLTYGGTSGNFMLTANVSACGVTTPVTLPVRVGPFISSDYTMTANSSSVQPLNWCPNQTYSFSVNGQGSNYQWTIPTGWTINYQSNYLCVLKAPSSSYPPTGTVSVTFTEPCGTQITKSFFTAYSSSACTSSDPRYTFSPNPAPSYLNVAVANAYTSIVSIKRIQIVSVNTGVTAFDQSYSGSGISSTYITTSSFQTGTYSLRINDGSTWAIYQFVR